MILTWTIDDRKLKANTLKSMPRNVQTSWSLWIEIVLSEGPAALANYPGFKDEAKTGDLEGFRASRLSGGWRVLYELKEDTLVVKVERVSNHDYKKRK